MALGGADSREPLRLIVKRYIEHGVKSYVGFAEIQSTLDVVPFIVAFLLALSQPFLRRLLFLLMS